MSDNKPKFATVSVLGEKLSSIRIAAGWTQSELAQRSGYTVRLINKAESGGSVRKRTLQDLLQCFR